MTAQTGENLLSKKHNRLLNIASAANICAWISLIIEILLTLSKYTQNKFWFDYQNMALADSSTNYINFLIENPLNLFNLVVLMASSLVWGVAIWLVLKGISVGLSMIVEIDLNNKQRASHE